MSTQAETVVDAPSPKKRGAGPARTARTARRTLLASHGEPWVWLTGGALALGLFMVLGLLAIVAWNGLRTLWPQPVVTVELADGTRYMGELQRSESYVLEDIDLDRLGEQGDEVRQRLWATGGESQRRLLRVARPGAHGENFNVWIADFALARNAELPADEVAAWEDSLGHAEWAFTAERHEGGRVFGVLTGFAEDGELVTEEPLEALERFGARHAESRELRRAAKRIEREEIGTIRDRLEGLRLAVRRAELRHGEDSEQAEQAARALAVYEHEAEERVATLTGEVRELRRQGESWELVLESVTGESMRVPLWNVVRGFTPNRLGPTGKLRVYADRTWELLSGEPRNGIQEGGLFPAIFGTVLMTLIMSVLVVPFGVLAALYLREYAKQGPLVSAVRIAVNNLAGVPSIVFGVFGLGFFCYLVGGRIDDLFYPERLPNPTFGKGGLIWASFTLALLTLPVVIVATEEALSAVPSSMREGSYACGATKWQTIQRIVLPRAMPGILTGMILAVARGAGEVAPLMVVGAVALAPELPFELAFPEFGVNRSFMHLGYHIYELGFKSPDAEAAIPFVYTTTLLLIAIVVVLNLLAIFVRARLRQRFLGT